MSDIVRLPGSRVAGGAVAAVVDDSVVVEGVEVVGTVVVVVASVAFAAVDDSVVVGLGVIAGVVVVISLVPLVSDEAWVVVAKENGRQIWMIWQRKGKSLKKLINEMKKWNHPRTQANRTSVKCERRAFYILIASSLLEGKTVLFVVVKLLFAASMATVVGRESVTSSSCARIRRWGERRAIVDEMCATERVGRVGKRSSMTRWDRRQTTEDMIDYLAKRSPISRRMLRISFRWFFVANYRGTKTKSKNQSAFFLRQSVKKQNVVE